MPSLTIDPARPPLSDANSGSVFDQFTTDTNNPFQQQRPRSPIAPAYSPITPKVQPVLPVVPTNRDGIPDLNSTAHEALTAPGARKGHAVALNGSWPTASQHNSLLTAPFVPQPQSFSSSQERILPESRSVDYAQNSPQTTSGVVNTVPSQHAPSTPLNVDVTGRNGAAPSLPLNQMQSTAKEPQFIPPPTPKPFSGEDNTDAIALRAAISALQFQKKKAIDDVRTLQDAKKQALADPLHFKRELVAGRLKEERSTLGDMRAVLDAPDSDDEGDDAGAVAAAKQAPAAPHGRTDSLTTTHDDSKTSIESLHKNTNVSFNRIPGPQDVVRMPYVNWEKYHIVGEPLDAIHDQQRRWPGNSAYGTDRGREYSVAAPYSPFHDAIDGNGTAGTLDDGTPREARNPPSTALMSPTGTISEHPMETRRTSRMQ